MMKMVLLLSTVALLTAVGAVPAAETDPKVPSWPETVVDSKPWAYNWWLGSAVDRKNISRELTRYRDAGLGGIHIVPIYGAKGAQDRSIDYLSPEWMEMMSFTVREARRLGLGVDITNVSGKTGHSWAITPIPDGATGTCASFEVCFHQ